MVARTVLDNFRVVGDNSDDIKAVFQVVLRLSQDVGECESDNCGQFNYCPEPISKFDHVNQRRFFRKQPNHRVSKNCRPTISILFLRFEKCQSLTNGISHRGFILILHFYDKVYASSPSRPKPRIFEFFLIIYFYQHDWVWLNLCNSQNWQLSYFLWHQLVPVPIFIHFIVSFISQSFPYLPPTSIY